MTDPTHPAESPTPQLFVGGQSLDLGMNSLKLPSFSFISYSKINIYLALNVS